MTSEPLIPKPSGLRLRRFRFWILAALLGAPVFWAAVVVFPRVFGLYYGYWEFKDLLQNQFHASASRSEFFAIAAAFVFAFFWAPMMWLTIRGAFLSNNTRRLGWLLAAWIFFYGTTPLLHILFGTEPCFNRATGEPLKWYVKGVGGQLIFFDDDGLDQTGVKKTPVSVEICRIAELQKAGILPNEISADPRTIRYFDSTTGDPIAWYSRAGNKVKLFDAEGFDPTTGELLKPVSSGIAAEARAQAGAREQEERAAEEGRQRAAEHEAAAAEAAAKEAAHRELVSEFGVENYAEGSVILGARAANTNESSKVAAEVVNRILSETLRERGAVVEEFAPEFYGSPYFAELMAGRADRLKDVGLAQKMRAAVLTEVEGECDASQSLIGVVSCTISLQVRTVSSGGTTHVYHAAEIGAGASMPQALLRAASLIAERHAEILQGV